MNIEMRHLEDAVGTGLLRRTATSLCVAWRADDLRPAVLGFVKVAAGRNGASRLSWPTPPGRANS